MTPDESFSSYGDIETDSDLDASCRFLLCSIKSGNSSEPCGMTGGCGLPIKCFRLGASPTPFCFISDARAEARGGPGEVGGLTSGAELMECHPRLRELELGLLFIR